MFVSSHGSAHARFTRAIQRGNLFAAEMAARELRRLSLEDALALTVLLSKGEAPRFERAAVPWHGRLELETQLLTLPESQLALYDSGRFVALPDTCLRPLLVTPS